MGRPQVHGHRCVPRGPGGGVRIPAPSLHSPGRPDGDEGNKSHRTQETESRAVHHGAWISRLTVRCRVGVFEQATPRQPPAMERKGGVQTQFVRWWGSCRSAGVVGWECAESRRHPVLPGMVSERLVPNAWSEMGKSTGQYAGHPIPRKGPSDDSFHRDPGTPTSPMPCA